MLTLTPHLDYDSCVPLYMQLYTHMKDEILNGSIPSGEKLPSLRNLGNSLKLSVTTIELSYNQLMVEGYIASKPKSGYFVNAIERREFLTFQEKQEDTGCQNASHESIQRTYIDPSLFDFIKWKKCINKVINDLPNELLYEANPQGELPLREQISKYLYLSRGVHSTPSQIIMAAGTQQTISLLCKILDQLHISDIVYEDPSYLPAINIFANRGILPHPIAANKEGLHISDLRQLPGSAFYTSPSSQFPTGYVMPIAKRYQLLDFANENNRIIIEDDYASELRYFGKPVPSLHSLDKNGTVVYLGSFSSTLFPSIKMSYLVLPSRLMKYYKLSMEDYSQTCSKMEQLALSVYMENGHFQTHIKKLRSLYSQKISSIVENIQKNMPKSCVTLINNQSGLNMLLLVNSNKDSLQLCNEAALVGIKMVPISRYSKIIEDKNQKVLIFYYSNIPLYELPKAISHLSNLWFPRGTSPKED